MLIRGFKDYDFFRAVVSEVLKHSSVKVDFYVPILPTVSSASDTQILYGEVPLKGQSYIKVSGVSGLFSNYFDYDYIESEQGVYESTALEFYSSVDEIVSKFSSVFGSNDLESYSFLGSILSYAGRYFEVVDEDFLEYKFNDPNSALIVTFSLTYTSRIPVEAKVD